jgi:hypothetical protein
MRDRTVSMHGIWRMGVAVAVGGLLLASTADARTGPRVCYDGSMGGK